MELGRLRWQDGFARKPIDGLTEAEAEAFLAGWDAAEAENKSGDAAEAGEQERRRQMIQGALIFMCGVWTGVICGFFLAGAAMLSKRADEDGESARRWTRATRYLARTRVYQGNESKEI
jgi:hypothetical protein